LVGGILSLTKQQQVIPYARQKFGNIEVNEKGNNRDQNKVSVRNLKAERGESYRRHSG